ncbi:hypothetical protein LINPERPRIM_LOCUS40625, partial [Linum perenne]
MRKSRVNCLCAVSKLKINSPSKDQVILIVIIETVSYRKQHQDQVLAVRSRDLLLLRLKDICTQNHS